MLLPQDVAQSVKETLATMPEPVTVKLFLKPGDESSITMKQLWEEIRPLAPNLVVEEHESVPVGMASEQMEGAVSELWLGGDFTGIRYLGVPSGYEFGPMIETLAEVSRKTQPEVSHSVAEWLGALDKPLHLEVFVTPT